MNPIFMDSLPIGVLGMGGYIFLTVANFFFTVGYVWGGLAILVDYGPKIGFFKYGLRGPRL